VIHQELRHSDFLAFLLDPRQSHGLGDGFLRRLLQKALRAARAGHSAVSPIDLDVWNLADAQVQREWRNLDIFVRDEAHQLAVIIENKVDSAEHSGQLERYHDVVMQEHPRLAHCRPVPHARRRRALVGQLRGRELRDGVQPGRRTRGEPWAVAGG
jgi:hypothetical protein